MARWTSDVGAMTSRTIRPQALARIFASSGVGSETAMVIPFSSRTIGTARWARATLSGRTSMASGEGVCWERSTMGTWSWVDRALARSRSLMAPSSTRVTPIRFPEPDCWIKASASWAWLISCAETRSSPSWLRVTPEELVRGQASGIGGAPGRGPRVKTFGLFAQPHAHSHQGVPRLTLDSRNSHAEPPRTWPPQPPGVTVPEVRNPSDLGV